MKLLRACDIGYRYTAELLIGLTLTAGQTSLYSTGQIFLQTAVNYHAAFLASYYLLDGIARTIAHPHLFEKNFQYRFDRGRGMLMRAGRNTVQFALNCGAVQLIVGSLLTASLSTQIAAISGFLLIKGMVDILYDLSERAYQNQSRGVVRL